MNMTSSRSHTIFCLTIEQIEAQNPDNTIISKFQIVDLAGSERQTHTLTTGEMQKEAIEINKSLFTLRKVITALTEKKEQHYVPYRDSKLTCLLRQSLGGNSMCCMIACLHPSDQYFEENKMTLEYAALALQIHNKPVKNDDPLTKQIIELKGTVKLLTMELIRANQHIELLSAICGH